MSAHSKSDKYGSPQGKLPGSPILSPSADHSLTAAKSQTSKVLGSASPLENTGHSAQPLSFEQRRALNIKRNEARLSMLGLLGPSKNASAKKRTTDSKASRPKKRSSSMKHHVIRRSSRLRVPTYSATGTASIGVIVEVPSPVISRSKYMMTQREKADLILGYAAENNGRCDDLTRSVSNRELRQAVNYFRDKRKAKLITKEVRHDLDSVGFLWDASHKNGQNSRVKTEDEWMETYNEYISLMDDDGKIARSENTKLYKWFQINKHKTESDQYRVDRINTIIERQVAAQNNADDE
eukprot:scaffold21033_cov68-Cyclotella_meneghiniana.AAC.9